MRTFLWLLFWLALGFALLAEGTNKVTIVTVDEEGNLNTSSIATVRDLAALEAEARLAAAKTEAAENAGRVASNEVNKVARAIVNNELVIYTDGYTSSFASMVLFSPDCKCFIYKFEPNVDLSSRAPLVGHDIYYALSENGAMATPVAHVADTLNSPLLFEDVQLDPPVVMNDTVEDGDGNTYAYTYKVRVYVPSSTHFFKVSVHGDTPTGDGYTFNISNGITGGKTDTISWGGNRLTFVGGLLTNVEDAE